MVCFTFLCAVMSESDGWLSKKSIVQDVGWPEYSRKKSYGSCLFTMNGVVP